jgi:hypothetical protein
VFDLDSHRITSARVVVPFRTHVAVRFKSQRVVADIMDELFVVE